MIRTRRQWPLSTISFSDKTWRMAGILLLALYVLAGGIYSFAAPPDARFPDEREYLALSHNLLHGPGYSMDGTHLTASRPPGYPFFLATLQSMGAGIGAIRLVQYLLVAATLLLICRACPAEKHPALLFFMTALVFFYPVLFYTAGTLYPQTLAAFLFALALNQLLTAGPGIARHFITGLVFGALILVVPTFALTLAVVVVIAWFLKMISLRNASILCLGAGLCLGIWTTRNALVFHRLVPIASNSGENLLIGNCENTIPYGGSGNVDRTHYQQEARALHLDEFAEDHYYQQAALNWIGRHPAQAFVLYLEKTANFFNVYNEYASTSQGEISIWKQVVMALSYILLIGLLLWRLIEMKRFPLLTVEKLFLLMYVLSAFTMAVFVTRIRYRTPYDYLIIAVIALHLSNRFLPAGTPRNAKPVPRN